MKKLIKQLKEIARKYADREEHSRYVYAYMEPMVYHRFGWPGARQRDTRSGLARTGRQKPVRTGLNQSYTPQLSLLDSARPAKNLFSEVSSDVYFSFVSQDREEVCKGVVMSYPARFEIDPSGTFVVTFRDIPEATASVDVDEALAMAKDALVTAMGFYFKDRRDIPEPSPVEPGEILVSLPANVQAKVLLLNVFLERQFTQVRLAQAMGVRPQEITRILDLGHPSKMDTIETALSCLGQELVLSVVPRRSPTFVRGNL